jgi:hypothetical protein
MTKNTKERFFWFGLFALCFVSFQYIQDTIRPNYSGKSEIIYYLLGVAPNFFPALGMPALFMIMIPEIVKNTDRVWLNQNRHITANLISATGLIGWELLQATGGNLRFDWHDILWTLIGAVSFHFTWKIKNNNQDPFDSNSLAPRVFPRRMA